MGRSVVVCGFPRDVKQAQSYEDKMGDPSLVLLLSCSPETMTQRGLRCGTRPGTDRPGTDRPGTDRPGTDRPGTDRPGTDPEAEKEESSEQFIQESRAVTQYYEDKHLLTTIDAERSADEVFSHISRALESFF
ncbi:unnamed protein product [Knipowitschia caucasica]|uniref:Adenylate kinase n=1 Tax=Knipowitschia caucasica TaxID=637954 RepID=A0AAV2JWR1_KNICA